MSDEPTPNERLTMDKARLDELRDVADLSGSDRVTVWTSDLASLLRHIDELERESAEHTKAFQKMVSEVAARAERLEAENRRLREESASLARDLRGAITGIRWKDGEWAEYGPGRLKRVADGIAALAATPEQPEAQSSDPKALGEFLREQSDDLNRLVREFNRFDPKPYLASEPQPEGGECPKCEGCGRVSNSVGREPWTTWENLPHNSNYAVRIGHVFPVTCPNCKGTGRKE